MAQPGDFILQEDGFTFKGREYRDSDVAHIEFELAEVIGPEGEVSEDRLITVVGSGYFQPILDLAEKLLLRPRAEVEASRIKWRENGYSLAIVLLSVVMFESFIGRVSDLQGRLGPKGRVKPQGTPVPSYIASLRKSFRLQKSLTEIFVLRDAIAHGHVWALTVSAHPERGRALVSATLGEGYGNRRFVERVNMGTRRTRALGLHVVPSAVGRKEAAVTLDVIHRVLKFLARSGLLEPNVFTYHGRFRGKPFEFWSILEALRSAP